MILTLGVIDIMVILVFVVSGFTWMLLMVTFDNYKLDKIMANLTVITGFIGLGLTTVITILAHK